MIAITFWTSSRYPALNAKALMGGDVPVFGIAFDNLFEVNNSASIYEKIGYNTINWVYTNKQGMTFGFLFAAAFMLLFRTLKKKTFNNPFLNAVVGTLLGAPLGVCVNCAAPIAKGVRSGGSKSETSISMMMSSPTLNVVVLTMLFAMLPWYLVLLKIGFTFILLWVIIPLLSRYISDDLTPGFKSFNSNKSLKWLNIQIPVSKETKNDSWVGSLQCLFIDYIKLLWFIVKVTLPLMLLAGLLGSIMTTLLPWDVLPDLFKGAGWIKSLLFMILLAVVGVFLPVPIAFDVIIVTILLSIGLPAQYAMILLFSLGIYSIYAFFIVGQISSIKMGISIALTVSLLAIGAGYLAKTADEHYQVQLKEEYFNSLKKTGFTPHRLEWKVEDKIGLLTAKNKELERVSLSGAFPKNIEIEKTAHFHRNSSSQKGFTKIEGSDLGIAENYYFEVKHTLAPFVSGKGLAGGDVNQDGWPDLVLATGDDVVVYLNMQGKGFQKQTIDWPLKQEPNFFAWNAALVDVNGDYWLDLVVTTFSHGNYILYNQEGKFNGKVQLLPNIKNGGVTSGLGFGDIDQDGDLDIACSNWTLGPGGAMGGIHYNPLNSSADFILWNENDSFRLELLNGVPGETLSLLLSDINGDNRLDLIVGNDFRGSDNYYLNSVEKGLQLVHRADSIIPKTTQMTMNIHSADIDNDLFPEVFLAAVSEMGLGTDWMTNDAGDICNVLQNPEERERCISIFQQQQKMVELATLNDISRIEYDLPSLKDDYIAYRLWSMIAKRRNFDPHYEIPKELCALIPDNFFPLKHICQTEAVSDYSGINAEKIEIPQKVGKNVLLKHEGNNRWADFSKNIGLESTGWAWNGKFSDLDLDGWQDLYVVNGFMFNSKQNSNLYFSNKKGNRFVNETKEQGFENNLPTHSYITMDYDLDGDLDIIQYPSVGPLIIYRNNAQQNSIVFQLKDHSANTHGVGAKIYCTTEDGKMHQFREFQASGGYKSYDPIQAQFGLGENNSVKKVQIVWPQGDTTYLNGNFKANNSYLISRQ